MSSAIIYPRLEYVYLIRHTPSGKFYAGSQWNKSCHPDKFWKTYFTSSKYIKQMIKDDGVDSFEVLEIIPRPLNDAREYESEFLKSFNAARNDKWINRANGDGKLGMGVFHLEETKRKISVSTKGIPKTKEHNMKNSVANTGRLKSDAHRKALSLSCIGRVVSEESKLKQSISRTGVKFTEEHKNNLSVALKGKPSKIKGTKKDITSCPYCNKTGGSNLMKRYHFYNCKLFSKPVVVDCVLQRFD